MFADGFFKATNMLRQLMQVSTSPRLFLRQHEMSALKFVFQEMPHCIRRGPDCRYCVFQLKFGASELLTPIFKFIGFVGIDSVVSEGSSLCFINGHGVSVWYLRVEWRQPKKRMPQIIFPGCKQEVLSIFVLIFSKQETPESIAYHFME